MLFARSLRLQVMGLQDKLETEQHSSDSLRQALRDLKEKSAATDEEKVRYIATLAPHAVALRHLVPASRQHMTGALFTSPKTPFLTGHGY